MKPILGKNIPPRAAIAVLALVLLASVLGSREAPTANRSDLSAPAETLPPSTGAPPSPLASVADLDPDRLRRKMGEGGVTELFSPRIPHPAPVRTGAPKPGAAAIPEAPSAPALPFQYLGKIIESGHLKVFLAKGTTLYTVYTGQTVENLYKVELVTEESVTFTYIPLGITQTLGIRSPT